MQLQVESLSDNNKTAFKTAAAAVICTVLFVVLAIGLKLSWWESLDLRLAEVFHSIQSDVWTPVLLLVSELGSAKAFAVLFVVTAGILLFRKAYRNAAVLFASTAGAYALNSLLKSWMERERPAFKHLTDADGFSFPSGNAMVATAFYGMLAILALHAGLKQGRWMVVPVTMVLLLLIGFSRLYLSVHYPTDIAAGYAAGAAWMLGCSLFLNRGRSSG